MPYNAFISYSHTADVTLAAALQSALHRFAKPWYKLRALHIFRDQTNLAVNPALWSSIREALDESLFFILLASPEAAVSPWVAKEAEYWIGRNGTSHVLLVLTGGTLKWDHSAGCFTPELTNSLPANLFRSFPEEPLFLDLRWARESGARLRLREPRFHEAILQLASTLHNRPKDELDGVDIRMRRHARWLAASALIIILLAVLFGLRQTRLSRQESIRNLAASLAAGSAKVLEDNPDRADEAALLAIESNRLSPSFEANQALRAAVSLLPADAQSYAADHSDPTARVRDIAFSPDGTLLAVVRDDGSTQLIDPRNRKPVGYITPDPQPAARIELPPATETASSDDNAAVSVAFNFNGSLLATGARDGSVHIWTVPDGREILRILHGAPVSQVAFRPGVNQIVTAAEDGHLRFFDVAQAAITADFKCGEKVASAVFSPDGKCIAALTTGGVVSVFDLLHRKLLRTMAGGSAGFNLAFSKDGKRLASANGEFAFVWDVATGRQVLKATHAADSETLTPQQWIVDTALSPDGKLLAYAARGDKFARVWSVETGRQMLELRHESAVAVVAFNADGTKLGSGSYDGTARVWELPSGSELERASNAGGAEVALFSPDGARFVAGGMEGYVSISGIRRADRPAFFHLPGEVRSVAFSPNGRRLAIGTVSAHASPLVRIAELGGRIVGDIEFNGAPFIDRLSFRDPDHVIAEWSDKRFLIGIGQASVTPLPDIPVQARNARTINIPERVKRESGDIDFAVGDRSSTAIAIASHGHLAIWDAATGARLAQIPDAGYIRAAAFSPDGRCLLAGYDERSAALWLWRSSDLRDQACARLTRNLSRDEWAHWFPKQRYRPICADLPPAN